MCGLRRVFNQQIIMTGHVAQHVLVASNIILSSTQFKVNFTQDNLAGKRPWVWLTDCTVMLHSSSKYLKMVEPLNSNALYLETCLVYLLCQLINGNVTGSTDKNLTTKLSRKKQTNFHH